MRSMKSLKWIAGMLACCTLVAYSALAQAADKRSDETSAGATTHRASKLIGMSVRNSQGEKLGTVEDLVADMNTGKIGYVAMGFGGVLGFGEKLFAVPFGQLKFERGTNESYFVLNVPKEELKTAPGFDRDHWPNMADPNWARDIDQYYHRHAAKSSTTSSVKTSKNQ
jgi:sporulation protein YlmC with PRC-barrel domain